MQNIKNDTTVFSSGTDVDALFSVVNKGLSSVDRWLASNISLLNIDKTMYVLIFNRSTHATNQITIRSRNLTRVSSMKVLGFIIDKKRPFETHINVICSKLSRTVGVMFRVSSFLPAGVITKMYFAIYYPHMIYEIAVFFYWLLQI